MAASGNLTLILWVLKYKIISNVIFITPPKSDAFLSIDVENDSKINLSTHTPFPMARSFQTLVIYECCYLSPFSAESLSICDGSMRLNLPFTLSLVRKNLKKDEKWKTGIDIYNVRKPGNSDKEKSF